MATTLPFCHPVPDRCEWDQFRSRGAVKVIRALLVRKGNQPPGGHSRPEVLRKLVSTLILDKLSVL